MQGNVRQVTIGQLYMQCGSFWVDNPVVSLELCVDWRRSITVLWKSLGGSHVNLIVSVVASTLAEPFFSSIYPIT